MKPYILQNESALYYECGFSCDNALFIRFNNSEAFFLTDSRYIDEAKEKIKDGSVNVVDAKRDLVKGAKKLIKKMRVKSLLFDPKDFSVARFKSLANKMDTLFLPKSSFLLKKREVKTQYEIECLKKAAIEGAKAYDRFCELVKKDGVGMNEKGLHFYAENILKDKGEADLSFSPIIAINENAAKPHALPSGKILKDGDLLLFDAGIKYGRYCSDRTRSVEISDKFNFSKTQTFKDTLKQKVYDTVLRAQEAAIKSVKKGIKAKDIDKAARDVIEKEGFGKYFIHSTGHGVGLDIHELPVISPKSDAIIDENMVFTIEPGIYLPNKFGIRIEDMVAVIDGKAQLL